MFWHKYTKGKKISPDMEDTNPLQSQKQKNKMN